MSSSSEEGSLSELDWTSDDDYKDMQDTQSDATPLRR